jgi:hypothetical protein
VDDSGYRNYTLVRHMFFPLRFRGLRLVSFDGGNIFNSEILFSLYLKEGTGPSREYVVSVTRLAQHKEYVFLCNPIPLVYDGVKDVGGMVKAVEECVSVHMKIAEGTNEERMLLEIAATNFMDIAEKAMN